MKRRRVWNELKWKSLIVLPVTHLKKQLESNPPISMSKGTWHSAAGNSKASGVSIWHGYGFSSTLGVLSVCACHAHDMHMWRHAARRSCEAHHNCFSLCPHHIKYLGIQNLGHNLTIFVTNKNIKTWCKAFLSWMDRVASVKNMVLPKFLFLFQNLPICISVETLKKWQEMAKIAKAKLKIWQI